MTLSTTSAAKVLQPETVVAEVVMNIDALAVSEPNPQELAHVVLRELSKSVDCFSAKPQGKALRMQCNDHAKVTPWPPKSGRDVANTVKAAFAFLRGAGHPASMSVAHRLARSLAISMGDPYTAYLPPASVKRLDTGRMAEVSNPGVELSPYDPSRIRAVRPGSNADEQGIRGGDRILEVDGISTGQMTLAELSAMLIGRATTTVRLLIEREGKGKRTFEVERTLIPEPTLTTESLPGGVLYLRISAFSPGVAKKVKRTIWERAPKGVVLDLRHNSGGLIAEGAELLDLFFADGATGGVRPRQGRPSTDFVASHDSKDLLRLPLVVLIDGGTASASELVSLSLKQRKRALIAGSRSLGKGSAQSLVRIPGGGLLRVTEAHYIGPLGRKLARAGITPDTFLPHAKGRTVLEGGDANRDAWVLMAADLLRYGGRAQAKRALVHTGFDDK